MKRFALALVLCTTSFGVAAAQDVPETMTFTARVLNEQDDTPLVGTHAFIFKLFDAETGGSQRWEENHLNVSVDQGLVYLMLGRNNPLDSTVFTGAQLWLEVTVDGNTMSPRVAIASVPYAVRAGVAASADTLGPFSPDDFITGVIAGTGLTGGGDTGDVTLAVDPTVVQRRVTGSCGAGEFIAAVNVDGTVVCAPDMTGSGDITDVMTPMGSGLVGGASAGAVNLSLIGCAPGEILRHTGAGWACSMGGDITGVATPAGGGLAGGVAVGDAAISLIPCGPNQVLKYSGTAWACANDVDSGGDVTAVNTSTGGGLMGGVTSGEANLSLIPCAAGQVLKYTGTAWVCAADGDTTYTGASPVVVAGTTIGLTAACAANEVLKWNGTTWACAADLDTNSGGDMTAVNTAAGGGLTGGAASGEANLSLVPCAAGQVLKHNGTAWLCAADTDTTYTGGAAISVSGTTIALSTVGCVAGEVWRYDGTAWNCVPDADTTYTGSGPVTVSGTTIGLTTSCGANQVLKYNGTSWACAADADTTYTGSGPVTVSGTTIGLTTSCGANQILKWNGSAWACAADVDTNSGGDITDVFAGTGLTGGGASGSVTLSLDTTYADNRYVNATGDTMTGALTILASGERLDLNTDGNNPSIELRDVDGTGLTPFIDWSNDAAIDYDMRLVLTGDDELTVAGGNLNMSGGRILNLGCPPGFSAVDSICVESCDECCFTFSQAAARCRSMGAHLCTSAEIRALMSVSTTPPGSAGCAGGAVYDLDWMADQVGDDSALYVNNGGSAANPDGSRATSNSNWTRCCFSRE